MLEGPTGKFRALFFKGDLAGLDGQRTPSAWLLPHSNKLTIRVSSDISADLGSNISVCHLLLINIAIRIGAETTMEIPTHEWCFLSFVFNNQSMDSQTNRTVFSLSVYLNGVLDVNMVYGVPVLANKGPLQLFKDISHAGSAYFLQYMFVKFLISSGGKVPRHLCMD